MAESDENSDSLTEDEEDERELICLFCKKNMLRKCRISHNIYLIKGLSSISIKYPIFPHVDDYSCYDCVKGILILVDQRRIIQRNILKNRANYFLNNGNRALCIKYLSKMRPENNQPFSPGEGSSNFKIISVRSIGNLNNENQSNEPVNERVAMPSTSKDADRVGSSPKIAPDCYPTKLLSVMYTKTEPAEFSESGGGITTETETKTKTPTIKCYKCHYCPRTYTNERFFIKHEKKHTDKRRTAARSIRTFRCNDCENVYTSLVQLKSHKKNHKEKFDCEHCGKQYFVKGDFEFHQAICSGKKAAVEGSRRPFTRSQKTIYSEEESDDDNDTDFETMNDDYNTAVGKWISNLGCEAPSENDDINSLFTSFTRASSRFNDFSDAESVYSSVSTKKKLNNNTIRTSVRRSKRLRQKISGPVCSESGCGKRCKNAKLLMIHEHRDHRIQPSFNCRVCGNLFTKRKYIEQHSNRELNGSYICHRCHRYFSEECLFKNHLDEHKICYGHECECLTCRLWFLTEKELQRHLCTNEHFRRKSERKSIIIERVCYKSENSEPSEKYKAIDKRLVLMDELRPRKLNIPNFHMCRFLDDSKNTIDPCIHKNCIPTPIKRDYGKHNMGM